MEHPVSTSQLFAVVNRSPRNPHLVRSMSWETGEAQQEASCPGSRAEGHTQSKSCTDVKNPLLRKARKRFRGSRKTGDFIVREILTYRKKYASMSFISGDRVLLLLGGF